MSIERAPWLLLLVLAACASGKSFVSSSDAGSDGDDDDASDGSIDCGPAAKWIYLVSANDGQATKLIRFEPDTKTMTDLGEIDCPSDASPFSMGIDREGTAWLLYNDGNLFQMDLETLGCHATDFVPNQFGLDLFGMAFVADAPGSNYETLFVSGGPDSSEGDSGIGATFGQNATLGVLRTTALNISVLDTLNGFPELTGTGDGELWGFAPNVDPMVVMKLDKTTAHAITTYDVSSIDAAGAGMTPSSWAFAFWAGKLYVFYRGLDDTSSSIWSVDPDNGDVTSVLTDIDENIVGAAVSTCAPSRAL